MLEKMKSRKFIANIRQLSNIYKQPFFEAPPSRCSTPNPKIPHKTPNLPLWAPIHLLNLSKETSLSHPHKNDVTPLSRTSQSASVTPRRSVQVKEPSASQLHDIMNQIPSRTETSSVYPQNMWQQPTVPQHNQKKKRQKSKRVAELLSQIQQNHIAATKQQNQTPASSSLSTNFSLSQTPVHPQIDHNALSPSVKYNPPQRSLTSTTNTSTLQNPSQSPKKPSRSASATPQRVNISYSLPQTQSSNQNIQNQQPSHLLRAKEEHEENLLKKGRN